MFKLNPLGNLKLGIGICCGIMFRIYSDYKDRHDWSTNQQEHDEPADTHREFTNNTVVLN